MWVQLSGQICANVRLYCRIHTDTHTHTHTVTHGRDKKMQLWSEIKQSVAIALGSPWPQWSSANSSPIAMAIPGV